MRQEEALHSLYVIDGIGTDLTPAALLREYAEAGIGEHPVAGTVVDESIDPNPTPSTFRFSEISSYVESILSLEEKFPVRYAACEAKARTAFALLESLWLDGHYRLGNLRISPRWRWSDAKVGNMAAFYESVEALSGYAGELGVKADSAIFEESEDGCHLSISTRISATHTVEEEDSEEIVPGKLRRCPAKAVPDEDSWIVYVPFDTCPYRLGGSALSAFAGNGGDNAPEMQDADYFIDCYEVVREMVEDGVAMSGITVGKGGLMTAASLLCGETGARLDIGGISASHGEDSISRILFAEVPGVLLQFSGNDFDYIDSQFLLQDVAYYPLGHPGGGRIDVRSGRPAVAGILDALLSQASEGED